MTLKEYAKSISKLAKNYPNVLVVSACDSTNESFEKVHLAGIIGFFDGELRGSFIDAQDVNDFPEKEAFEEYVGKKPNAVCIN
jgi:hypothetical protein